MSSPSATRRRPLKESKHVSIEKTGHYLQLNQYLLKDPIGQVIDLISFKRTHFLETNQFVLFLNTLFSTIDWIS